MGRRHPRQRRSASLAALGELPHRPKGRYRSKWYALGNDHDAFCGIGIHGQWIYVDPAAEVTIAKLSSQPLPLDEATDFLILRAFESIAAALM